MKRVVVLVVLGVISACGGNDPSVSQVTVTVKQGGAALPETAVVKSAGMDSSHRPSTPVDVLETVSTNSSGQVTFSVPASTSTGSLCFSAAIGNVFDYECHTLNDLPGTLQLDDVLPGN